MEGLEKPTRLKQAECTIERTTEHQRKEAEGIQAQSLTINQTYALKQLVKGVPKEEVIKSSMDGYCLVDSRHNHKPARFEGYLLGIVSAFLSALAGVYTEFLMKKTNESLYWQNAQLYAFGVLFNFLRLVLAGGWQKVWGLLDGYDSMTWLVVLNLGCTGLLVSWIMKYADNIVKVYATSMAMLLTMILSTFLFDFMPSLQLFLGIVICTMSLQMYFTPPHMLVDLSVQLKYTNASLSGMIVEKATGNQ